MTKAAVNNMVWWLATELKPHNIRVNGIAPGVVRSEMTRFLFENDWGKQLSRREYAEPE